MSEKDYYLDLDYISEFCAIKTETSENDNENNDEDENKITLLSTGIDVFKYEIVKMCLDRLLFDKEVNPTESELMSIRRSNEEDSSYKLAFNTLLAHKIIKPYEREY